MKLVGLFDNGYLSNISNLRQSNLNPDLMIKISTKLANLHRWWNNIYSWKLYKKVVNVIVAKNRETRINHEKQWWQGVEFHCWIWLPNIFRNRIYVANSSISTSFILARPRVRGTVEMDKKTSTEVLRRSPQWALNTHTHTHKHTHRNREKERS